MAGKTGSHLTTLSECPLCTQPYKEPKLLKCGHTLCLPCLERMWITNNRDVRCPFDRKLVKMPALGPDGLAVNRVVANYMGMITNTGKKMDDKCEHCLRNKVDSKAEFYCKDCPKYMCSTCSEKHSEKKVFAKHDLVSSSLPSMACKQHSKAYRYHCEDCNKLLCVYCVDDEVCDSHSVKEIFNVLDNCTKKLKDAKVVLCDEIGRIKKDFQPKTAVLEGKICTLTETIHDVKEHVEKLLNEISEKGGSVIKELEDERAQLVALKNETSPAVDYQLGLLHSLKEAAALALNQGPENIVLALPTIMAQVPNPPTVGLDELFQHSNNRTVIFNIKNSLKVGNLMWITEEEKPANCTVAKDNDDKHSPILGKEDPLPERSKRTPTMSYSSSKTVSNFRDDLYDRPLSRDHVSGATSYEVTFDASQRDHTYDRTHEHTFIGNLNSESRKYDSMGRSKEQDKSLVSLSRSNRRSVTCTTCGTLSGENQFFCVACDSCLIVQ